MKTLFKSLGVLSCVCLVAAQDLQAQIACQETGGNNKDRVSFYSDRVACPGARRLVYSINSYLFGDQRVDLEYKDDGASVTGIQVAGDFTIPAGVTVSTPSGMTIRATGECNIAGKIVVAQHAAGARMNTGLSETNNPVYSFANPGLSLAPAGSGALANSSGTGLPGGLAGLGLGATSAVNHLATLSGIIGGGGGAAGYNTTGGSGGGILRIFCAKGINVAGTIEAPGAAGEGVGAGGGGGGIVILATSDLRQQGGLRVTGAINVPGGAGADGGSQAAPGGGGGGGLIYLIYAGGIVAPEANMSVEGGEAGSNGSGIAAGRRVSGGGGGASIGNGGSGGSIDAADTITAAANGAAGLVVRLQAAPGRILRF
jgi:hypothetical protein